MVLSRTAETDPAKPSPEQQLRLEWSANLRRELLAKRPGPTGMSAKEFHHLLTEAGAKVTQQAVYNWLSGATAPSPINQAYVAHVLQAPAERLFSLPEVQG